MNKFCVNCFHYSFMQGSRMDIEHHLCKRKNKLNLVTGKITIPMVVCEEERNTNKLDHCGPHAKFFKEKL